MVLQARNLGRRLGLNSKLSVLLNGKGYEARYDSSFQAELKAGHCVWDVGANVGYYTRQFAEKVGTTGKVFAFEPSPQNFNRLGVAVEDLAHVSLLNVGLGTEPGRLSFQQGADDLGATSRVVKSGEAGAITVEISTGNLLVAERRVTLPNAIKIDVEGFELEVLQGMKDALKSPALRTIGIEVHFGILRERGMTRAPQEIEALLQACGFKVNWPDASHILAIREG